MKNIGLYIHIPFCESKCFYCDFTSIPTNNSLVEKYFDYLLKELSMASLKVKDYVVDTIFIGGGTPSILDGIKIEVLFENIRKKYALSNNPEVTIEVNPGTLDTDKTESYKRAGINRISIGIQSMNNNSLLSIGRIHNKQQVIETIKICKDLGFHNISGDLIFGLPNERIEDFKSTLQEIIKLNLSHISMYGLILEKGTKMYSWYKKGLLHLPDESEEREMYHLGIDYLEEHGYLQYEISNFAKKGFKSKHNIGYWELKPYIGIGLASHSNIDSIRYWNEKNFKEYFRKLDVNLLPIEGSELIDKTLKESEYLILGIRMNKGISKIDYKDKFGVELMGKHKEAITKHIDNGLLSDTLDNIQLTRRGMDLSNLVEIDFL
ncbi:MAG: radical SAM family heme chaperone HemW [Tissierellia bacterium]|nr:radical SAM family heme chaperone HemW [Tissierellia bacterium]